MTTSPKTSKTSCLDGIRTVLKAWGSEARSVGMTGSRIAELVRKTGAWTAPSADPAGTVLRTLNKAVAERTPVLEDLVLVRTDGLAFRLVSPAEADELNNARVAVVGAPPPSSKIDFPLASVEKALKNVSHAKDQAQYLHAAVLETFMFAVEHLGIDLRLTRSAVLRITTGLCSEHVCRHLKHLLNFSIAGLVVDGKNGDRVYDINAYNGWAWLDFLAIVCHEAVHMHQELTGIYGTRMRGDYSPMLTWRNIDVCSADEYNNTYDAMMAGDQEAYWTYLEYPWEIDANVRGIKTARMKLKAGGILSPAADQHYHVQLSRFDGMRNRFADKWPDLAIGAI